MYFFGGVVLGTGDWTKDTLYMQDKCSTTNLYPSSVCDFFKE